jgi:hypothetical protein
LPRFVRHLDDEREPKNVTVNGPEWQTGEFERHGPRLHAVVYAIVKVLDAAGAALARGTHNRGSAAS